MSEQHKPSVIITSDGAARGNPGPGGWAALLEANGKQRLLQGEGPEQTTNNAMELYAATAALESLKRPCRVLLRLDSRYVLDGLERLLAGGRLPEKNRALWQQLLAAAQRHEVAFEWVRGHNGDRRNEQVDRAATAAASRAFIQAEAQRAPVEGPRWTLALCSPTSSRPAQWALHAPAQQPSGSVAVARGITQPTAMYQALLRGLEAAHTLPGATQATLEVVSNYELIIKQGRGEWQVKNADQQPLARQVAALRPSFAALEYRFAKTDEVLELLRQHSS